MKETVFVDIDTQFDFMYPAGALYVPGAGELIPKLKRLSRFAAENDLLIISTVDTHKKMDPEFKQFPSHCLRDTEGQKKIKQTLLAKHCFLPQKALSRGELFKRVEGFKQVIFEKNTYDAFINPNLGRILKPFTAAVIYGVALDYCVKYAVLGFLQSGLKVNLVTDATQAIDAKYGQRLMRWLKKSGVGLVKTKEVINRVGK